MTVRAFAIVSYLVFGLELFAAVLFTSNTANILAWGIFGSTAPIANNRAALIIFEAVHTSPALVALALGFFCTALSPLIDVCRANVPSEAIPRFYRMNLVSLIGMVAIALFCNLYLMHFPGSKWHGFWARSMLEMPADFHWATYWLFVIPLAIVIVLSFKVWRDIHWWAAIACLLAVPLLVFPLLIRTYMAHHYLCSSNPDIYSTALSVSFPVFFVIPIATIHFLDRLLYGRVQASSRGAHNNG